MKITFYFHKFINKTFSDMSYVLSQSHNETVSLRKTCTKYNSVILNLLQKEEKALS